MRVVQCCHLIYEKKSVQPAKTELDLRVMNIRLNENCHIVQKLLVNSKKEEKLITESAHKESKS